MPCRLPTLSIDASALRGLQIVCQDLVHLLAELDYTDTEEDPKHRASDRVDWSGPQEHGVISFAGASQLSSPSLSLGILHKKTYSDPCVTEYHPAEPSPRMRTVLAMHNILGPYHEPAGMSTLFPHGCTHHNHPTGHPDNRTDGQ